MRSVDWVGGTFRFIDQTKLPREETTIQTRDPEVVAEAIRSLRIRGAPAIGVAAAFGVVLHACTADVSSVEEVRRRVAEAVELFGATRPTAVNLFAALHRMKLAGEGAATRVREIQERLLGEALGIWQEDIDACNQIAALGSSIIGPGSVVLTHCNTGALATAGEGTALGIITAAAAAGKIDRVIVGETRPLFQGSRLTAWELVKHGIPTTVITDSAAGSVFQHRKVHCVIVGADRIAANGDTANKVGTYPLALLALHHSVPVYVAAPSSTFDLQCPTGEAITIEERDGSEVTDIGGLRIAAEGSTAFNPAFDITPNDLVTAFITERGILRKPFRESIVGAVGIPHSSNDRHR